MAGLADAYRKLMPDIVLVVGDRVEPFAAAAAGHIAGIPIAHVHGGDRALGQVDDSLRHAITKLAHIHLPATQQSAERIAQLGEDPWRIYRVGSPGVDDIVKTAMPRAMLKHRFAHLSPHRFAVLVLHPTDTDPQLEHKRAKMVLAAALAVGFDRLVIVYPNNDPGASGIIKVWQDAASVTRITICRDLPRAEFLGLMREAAVLVGNSSSGIIEAASFHTPVVDIGPRQAGRQRSDNVRNVPFQQNLIRSMLASIWNDGRPLRPKVDNVYGGNGAGKRIAGVLARIRITPRILHKVIAY